jgi:taurine dioxygenase
MPIKCLEPFGAEVSELQLAALSDDAVAAVERAIIDSRVVVFRNQRADDGDLVQFLKKLGTIMFTDGEIPVEDAPDLNRVSNIGRTTPPRSVFHTDTSYVQQPPAFSALRAVMLPAAGGETLFSDQVRVASALPAVTQRWLEGRTILHSAKGPDGAQYSVRHPLLRRHLVSGQIALYLSTPERCSHMSGLDGQDSARAIALLYRRSIRPNGLYRHFWRPNDIVIWDNRTTMHRADHAAVIGDRVLHRGMVRGEVPLAA